MATGNDYHSGGGTALKAEQKGAVVEKQRNWFIIRNDKGECVQVPDRGLHPNEYRHLKALLKAMGILIPLFLVARWLL